MEQWISLAQEGNVGELFGLIETSLSQATYAAQFISEFSSLNALASDIDWRLGAEQTGSIFIRANTLTRVRLLAAEMLWCDFYGGCGEGEPITLRECITFMVCDSGITLADVWDMHYGLAEIEGARRLADDLKELMPNRLFP